MFFHMKNVSYEYLWSCYSIFINDFTNESNDNGTEQQNQKSQTSSPLKPNLDRKRISRTSFLAEPMQLPHQNHKQCHGTQYESMKALSVQSISSPISLDKTLMCPVKLPHHSKLTQTR